MTPTGSIRRLGLLLTATMLVASGCAGGTGSGDSSDSSGSPSRGSSGSSGSSSPSAPSFQRYVALGDSYTAAPYVYLTDVANGCFRSNDNYPSQLARKLRPSAYFDVSCSGATTRNLIEGQRGANSRIRAQLRSVTAKTDLVTVGIGGNDFGLFGSLARRCGAEVPGSGPQGDGTACGTFSEATVDRQLRGIGANVTGILRRVHRQASQALVVLVGYPRLTGDRTCPSRIPVTREALPRLAQVIRRLNDELKTAARATDSTFVDVYAASKGHDICSEKPWVNGVRTDTNAAAALHPFVAEQTAVADLIDRAITEAVSRR